MLLTIVNLHNGRYTFISSTWASREAISGLTVILASELLVL